MEDRPGIPTGCPEATMTTRPLTSVSDSHTITPVLTDVHANEAQTPAITDAHADEAQTPAITDTRTDKAPAPASTDARAYEAPAPTITDAPMDEAPTPVTTGVHGEAVSALATVQGTLPSTSDLPTDVSPTEGPSQITNGPVPKKRKVSAPAIVSDSISDKYYCPFLHNAFLIVLLGIYVGRTGSRVTRAARKANLKNTGSGYPEKK